MAITLKGFLVATKPLCRVSDHSSTYFCQAADQYDIDENTSEAAKAHAREVLEAAGYTIERATDIPKDEHEKRVLAGYKAALHSKLNLIHFAVEYDAKNHVRPSRFT